MGKQRVIKDQNIICIASSNWNGSWLTAQHLMWRLSQWNRVLFVESIGLRTPSVKRTDLVRIVGRVKDWFTGAKRVKDNLYIYSPVIVPLHQIPAVRRINSFFLQMELRHLQKRFGLNDPILWIFLPTGVGLVRSLGEKLVIYHCVDEYAANPGVSRRIIQGLEEEMLRASDLVFTTSSELYLHKRPYNDQTFLQPNVADVDHFMNALDQDLEVPEELNRIPGPRLGFIGNITSYKVDLELIAELAGARPDWSVVLIGPVGIGDPSTDVSDLRSLPNVHFLGEKDQAELPAYLKGLDLCMIPFRRNESTDSSFPLKFFEYLAAGKPVVTTDIASLGEYEGSAICYTAHDTTEFIRLAEAGLAETGTDRARERVALARENTWDVRVEEISRIIMDTLD